MPDKSKSGDARESFSQEWLKSAVSYDPETGVMRWRPRARDQFKSNAAFTMWNKRYALREMGFLSAEGYRRCRIGAFLYNVHRLVFFYMTGVWPPHEIDHINHNRGDNRWANLRSATDSDNARNHTRRKSQSGHTGVVKSGRGWLAKIGHGHTYRYLGTFDSIEEAYAARRFAEQSVGYHPNHGQPAIGV